MKIAIVSDSHDNLANIEKAFDYINKEGVEIAIHCGDVCTSRTLREILNKFNGKFHLVFGNVDGDRSKMEEVAKMFPNCKIWGETGELIIEGKKIAFLHFPEFARNLASQQKYDFVFYGHTHKPFEEKIGKTRLINPGNLAGLYYKASFAIYDLKEGNLELKILEMLK